jgi:hypothetical protein
LEEEPTEGDMRRIIDLLFESKFVNKTDNHLINNINIFEKNVYYVENEFREKYKFAMLKILFEHNKNHYIKDFIIPDAIKNRTLKYVESSIEIFEWFNDNYEKMENYTVYDFIRIVDINDELKISEYYNSLEKSEKRALTKDKLIKMFKENPIFKQNFGNEIDTYVNGERFKAPVRINGYRKRLIID